MAKLPLASKQQPGCGGKHQRRRLESGCHQRLAYQPGFCSNQLKIMALNLFFNVVM